MLKCFFVGELVRREFAGRSDQVPRVLWAAQTDQEQALQVAAALD